MSKALSTINVQGILVNPDVAEFYKKNAQVGSDNINRDSFPTLKVIESNSKSLLLDGRRPSIGNFFYTKDRQEFPSVEVSIMSVSRGFYVKPMNDGDDPKFQQIIAGMILSSMKPFIMYISGKRLSPLWLFGKELSPYIKHKDNPIPMMAFMITLTTTNYKHRQGDSHYINFTINRDGNKQPQLITDIGILEVLRNGIDSMEESVKNIIEATEVDKTTGEYVKNMQDAPIERVIVAEDSRPIEATKDKADDWGDEFSNGEVDESEVPQKFESKDNDVADDIPF